MLIDSNISILSKVAPIKIESPNMENFRHYMMPTDLCSDNPSIPENKNKLFPKRHALHPALYRRYHELNMKYGTKTIRLDVLSLEKTYGEIGVIDNEPIGIEIKHVLVIRDPNEFTDLDITLLEGVWVVTISDPHSKIKPGCIKIEDRIGDLKLYGASDDLFEAFGTWNITTGRLFLYQIAERSILTTDWSRIRVLEEISAVNCKKLDFLYYIGPPKSLIIVADSSINFLNDSLVRFYTRSASVTTSAYSWRRSEILTSFTGDWRGMMDI
eukprot:GHVP01039867.1.p1 GENE.GHVP01039867.1~~GHVP01039867.1.p1  ORF type:complete len:270 (+),score=29.17 GHVP01039867.1:2362-3171(+)